MSTISKISMIGYAPIANRKSDQKASNPISSNMQDSRDLMSPNAHYGKHAVSFKARISTQEAEHFIESYRPLASVDSLSAEASAALDSIKLRVNKLLNIMAEPKCVHLKDQALGHLSGLVNHDNDMFRDFTLKYIKTGIKQDHALAVPELFDHIAPRIKDNDWQVRENALNALGKCLKFVDHKSRKERLPKLFDDYIIPSLGDEMHLVRLSALKLAGKYAPLVAPESRHKSLPEVFSKYIIDLLDSKKDSNLNLLFSANSDYNNQRRLSMLKPLNRYAESNLAIVTPELRPELLEKLETLKNHTLMSDQVRKAASSLHSTLLIPRQILEAKKVFTAKSIVQTENDTLFKKCTPKLERLDDDLIGNIASFLHSEGSRESEDPKLILAQHKPQQMN